MGGLIETPFLFLFLAIGVILEAGWIKRSELFREYFIGLKEQ